MTMDGDRIQPTTPAPAKPDNPVPSEVSGRDISLARMKLDGYFGIQSPTTQDDKSLSEIVRILDGDKIDPVDFLWQLKSIEDRIGTPPLGVSRLQHVYNFIRIGAQIGELRKEQAAYGA